MSLYILKSAAVYFTSYLRVVVVMLPTCILPPAVKPAMKVMPFAQIISIDIFKALQPKFLT